MEILEAGAKGHFYLELVTREEDRATGREEEMEQELARIFQGIQAGEIRIGSKKTRGFGQFKIESIGEKIIQKTIILSMQMLMMRPDGKIVKMY